MRTADNDKKIMPSESPTSAWLKTNGTKPKSRVKVQNLSPQAPSLNRSTDVIAPLGMLTMADSQANHDDSEAKFQAIQSVLEGLENIIVSSEIFTIPDMQITLTPTTKKPSPTQVLWYTETTFTQTKRMALGKIEKVLLSHHEIACVLFILILERLKYEASAANSTTYGEALADKSVQPLSCMPPVSHQDVLAHSATESFTDSALPNGMVIKWPPKKV
ncbi:hypothetical protein F4604DRAFT_1677039 [Suillus subluteus]|nr:hypothetical protein F4604DRAFT_1677039 [Suillus subluteus]